MNRVRYLPVALLCAVLALAACSKKVIPPKDVKVGDGFFTVTVPGKLEFACRDRPGMNVGTVSHVCVGQTDFSMFYTVSSKLQDNDAMTPERWVDNATNYAAQLMDSSVASSRAIESEGGPGKDFKLRTLRGAAWGRAYAAYGQLVFVIAVAKPGIPDNDDIQAFVGSLRPIKPK
jgi:hypothetical protein